MSAAFASRSSRRCSSVTSGYRGSSSSSACTRMAPTQMRANHLWSAGITYHGAHSVLVWDSMSENARW